MTRTNNQVVVTNKYHFVHLLVICLTLFIAIIKPAMHNTANNIVPIKKVIVKKFIVPFNGIFVVIYASKPKAIIKEITPNADTLLLKYSFLLSFQQRLSTSP